MATAKTANLFTQSTKVKETAKKPEKKVIKAETLNDKIQQFLKLKQEIEASTGQLKMIEGDIKTVGKELFLKEYKAQRSTPDNFKIQDATGSQCLFICMDKYTLVDEGKAELLTSSSDFEGILAEKVEYKFNAELVEKYGEILSKLILNCKSIADEDKPNLITGEKTFSIEKGTIDRIFQYKNPEQVFELINPICALKK